MKRCDYLNVNQDVQTESNTLDKSSLDSEKKDEIALPEFVKALPLRKRKKESDNLITVEYEWGEVSNEQINVKSVEFRKDEGLDNLYRINKKDGTDEIALKHDKRTYVLRKTTKNTAVALMNASKGLKGLVENVVGWLKTIFGTIYTIARIDKWSWTFNRSLVNGSGINVLDVTQLNEKGRERLCEVLTAKLVELHKKGLVIRNFSINNLWLAGNDLLFADLRNLKLAKKKSVLVDEFRKILNYLFSVRLATRVDVYSAIAYYMAAMEESCAEWYIERVGREARDSFEVSLEIEKTMYA